MFSSEGEARQKGEEAAFTGVNEHSEPVLTQYHRAQIHFVQSLERIRESDNPCRKHP